LSSNEAIKQMCAAGFGVAFLSMHACVLELQAGLLAQVPVAGQPIERDWYVISLAGRAMPAAATAFEAFLREQGPALIDQRRYQPPAPAIEPAAKKIKLARRSG
jgi:DNA-binding transcriptional LysR family regulator